MEIRIDQTKCNSCGICGQVCPRHIIETEKNGDQALTRVSQARRELCMDCGQCAAVCPRQAVSLEAFDYQAFEATQSPALDYQGLTGFLTARRSVRRYKDKPVEREVLDKIARAAGLAPAGAGRASTGVLIIDDPDRLAELSGHVFKVYRDLEKALANPIGRAIVKRKAGPLNFATLREFVMPGMSWYIRWRDEGRGDEILRDCRALMLFHTDRLTPTGKENCVVAAWHAIQAAQTLGLGSCMNDLIPPGCNRSPAAKDLLGLGLDQEVMTSLTLGWPKFKYLRTIPRELVSHRYVD